MVNSSMIPFPKSGAVKGGIGWLEKTCMGV